MELFDDKVPRTAENFRKLCTGEAGMGETTKAPLHYKNTIFHRVVAGFIIQGGDFSNFNGTGGESVFGGRFEDESFEVKHNKRGLLSMANTNEAHSNGSQFFITCDANCAHLDGKNVAFGELISGFDVLDVIENQRTVNDRPVQQVTIVDCGIEVCLFFFLINFTIFFLYRSAQSAATQRTKRRRRPADDVDTPQSPPQGWIRIPPTTFQRQTNATSNATLPKHGTPELPPAITMNPIQTLTAVLVAAERRQDGVTNGPSGIPRILRTNGTPQDTLGTDGLSTLRILIRKDVIGRIGGGTEGCQNHLTLR